MNQQLAFDPETLVAERFRDAGISILAIETRRYPDESIVVVRVSEAEMSDAASLANEVDSYLRAAGFSGFVAVRTGEPTASTVKKLEQGVSDERAGQLASLLNARSRTSEVQPSLTYIRDAAENILSVTTSRHHLIFGRRGAGKTALMVEAKKRLEQQGHVVSWSNLQTLRNEAKARVFLWVARTICDSLMGALRDRRPSAGVPPALIASDQEIDRLLGVRSQIPDQEAQALIPMLQTAVSRSTTALGVRLYAFLDDLQYLPRADQPVLLDMVHGVFRDCDAWIKVSAIKHLTRWFQPSPPLGLQTGHDAAHIDLDVTLENPSKAKNFLETMLKSYASHVGIGTLGNVFSSEALDRLVLASGAVPRDYLVLSAGAISQARRRAKSRTVGVQDVNKAAGDAANVKITELEDDAASTGVHHLIAGLRRIQEFCLVERRCTYFRVDYRDKETHTQAYAMLQELMDLRLAHLVNASVSDEREAGRKSEVFMLDLSQFSGERLKKRIKVLDFDGGYLVVKESGKPSRVGSNPKQLLAILRRGPQLSLDTMAPTS